MAFVNNNFNGNNCNQQSDKPKTNFKLGRIWGDDGKLDISTWNADTGTRIIIGITRAIGKDPDTGAATYEQKKPNELPRFFMNADRIRAFIERCDGADPSTINFTMEGSGSKLIVQGCETNVKITIESQKQGTRTITIGAVNLGGVYVHAGFKNMIDLMKIGHKKALYSKIDPDEFAVALGSANDDNTPFE